MDLWQSPDDLRRAVSDATLDRLAELTTLVIGLAASNPRFADRIRDSLKSVFDLKAVEEHAKNAEVRASEISQRLEKLLDRCFELDERLTEIERGQDGIRHVQEQIVARQAKIRTWAAKVHERLKRLERVKGGR